MKRKIMIGGDREYWINYDQETADEVLNMIMKWMEQKDHYASHSGESIYQNDECQTDAIELISDIIDDVLCPESIDDEE